MTSLKKALGTAILAGCFALSAPAAFAGDFSIIDVDASGGLSLAEVQAVAPDVTEDDFVSFDIDGTGELSETEYETWKASMTPEDPIEDDGALDDDGDDLDDDGSQ